MAKGKNNELMATLAGVFCFFVVFLKLVPLLASFSFSGLLLPSLWLLLGLCLLMKKKNWLCVVAMLPLVILTAQGIFSGLPMDSVQAFLQALLCRVLPAVGMVILWLFFFLCCIAKAGKLRRELWFLPILLVLPGCIWQSASTLPWAEFGMIACVSLWLKPAGK